MDHEVKCFMVKIRLARGGSKKRPFYNVVVTDSREPRDGSFIERIGFFNPIKLNENKELFINLNKVKYWMNKGAQPSNRVLALIKKAKSFENIK